MSQTKYHMPQDVKQSAIAMVRGYERRVKNYDEARYNIIYETPCNFATYTIKSKGGNAVAGEQRRQYFSRSNVPGNPTADKQQRLEALEGSIETLRMRAVEQAKLMIGLDLADENLRRRLTDAIWESCIKGRHFTFEYWDLPMGKTNFYERRNEFLSRIAVATEYL